MHVVRKGEVANDRQAPKHVVTGVSQVMNKRDEKIIAAKENIRKHQGKEKDNGSYALLDVEPSHQWRAWLYLESLFQSFAKSIANTPPTGTESHWQGKDMAIQRVFSISNHLCPHRVLAWTQTKTSREEPTLTHARGHKPLGR